MRKEAFKSGSEFPPCQPGLIRLYSMRFCPYAERALLVANALQIPHEIVNVSLTEKPSWFLEKHYEGTVPVLEHDGKVVGGSLVVADYLDEANPEGTKLVSADPYQRAKDKMLIDRFGKFGMQFFSLFPDLLDGKKEKAEELFKGMEWVEEEITARGTPFFAGQSMGMVDLMIWPWLERIEAVSAVPVPQKRFPNLTAWTVRMRQEPVIQKTCVEPDLLKKFFIQYRTKSVDYDMGL